ncbi:M56 family metallopeptidase [Lutibacter sp.]|uniref:M56 family metallopeptidase n=1 Tax=Lutibacter sp. TaxID=1925666 RepID=UPI0025C48D21|nr:M56 family metallopeptidase [Lutibacter sp.]MCF6167141.1 M56 family metallopeptidase [Lutibacter sp.]
MINYIVQVVLFQALFLAVYDFFLQKETFFKWNRFYLLSTPILSFIIPLLKFESIQKTIPQEYIEQLPTVFLNPQEVIVQANKYSSAPNHLAIIFYVGLALFLVLFLIKLFKIFQLIATNKVLKKENYSLVLLDNRQSAFSFFNYIFINKHLLKSEDLQIIKHELVHCKQNHTLDLLFFEILKIVLWFNPMVYVYQKRITLLHEYISDAEVVLKTDKKMYFNKLLAETFNVENISFINQFFKHSLIKKRIVMITKEKSKKMKQLKYLLMVPLLVSMLVYVSCSNDSQIDIEQVEKILNEENSISEGKYFEGENGFKMFVGTHLVGEVVSIEEYTEKEKMVFNKFKNIENSKLEISIIINENGDRVFFAKTKYSSNENNKKINDNDGSIPFATIEDVPVFPGCTGTKLQLRTCLQEKITSYVSSNFNSKLANSLGLKPGVKRIFVMFKIDKEGNITDVKSRAPHQKLADEAIRVINLLPKMMPGKQNGKAVGVKYSLPIAFKVE